MYQIYKHTSSLELESGATLENLKIAYHTYGSYEPNKNNVIWVCHALTANSDVFEWWPGLFGENDFYNPKEHFIICANIIGSCYGSTGPLSFSEKLGRNFYSDFPKLSIRDMIKVHQLLAKHLNIGEIHTLIGGSLGGQQAIEWAVMEPVRIKNLILLATNSAHSPWGIAFNEAQRMALTADPSFTSHNDNVGQNGLKAARAIAMLSYRNYKTYQKTQLEIDVQKTNDFKASSYQQYQGEKLAKRFNAYSYWILSKAMDSHNLGRNRKNLDTALQSIQAKTLSIGISTDILFPPEEQQLIAHHVVNGRYVEIDSLYGHDGFLIETKSISKIIGEFYLQKN